MSHKRKAKSNQDRVLGYLQNYKEDDFTNKVLVPLFSQLGYDDVHFHGGSYEKGKDFIAAKNSIFGGVEITVGQVKKIKSTRNLDTRKDFQTLIYQLRECHDTEILYKDGTKYFPRDIVFITPYVLETRLIEEQFSNIGLNTREKIRIIDGAKLYTMLLAHLPKFIEELSGIESKIESTAPESVLNIELMNALSVSGCASSFYCDLNFFVGNIDSNILLNSEIEFLSDYICLDVDEWKHVVPIINEINIKSDYDVFIPKVSEIERAYNSSLEEFLSDENQSKINYLKVLEEKFYSDIADIGFESQSLESKITSKENMSVSKNYSHYDVSLASIGKINILIKSISKASLTSQSHKEISPVYKEIQDLSKSNTIELFKDNIEKVVAKFNNILVIYGDFFETKRLVLLEPKYKFKFSENNKKIFNRELLWYSTKIGELNSSNLTISKVRSFISRVENILTKIYLVKSKNKHISRCVNIVSKGKKDDRLSISIHSIFDSGVNVALFGEAGAGKTTTLQAYAKDFFQKNDLLLYLPLNRVAIKYKENHNHIIENIEFTKNIYQLLSAIILFVGGLPTQKDVEDLEAHLNSKGKVVFVFDALDEAIKEIPWILRAISNIPSNFDNSQIIVSSRDCASYISDIDFIGVTLLPFTSFQLKEFIKGWIEDTDQAIDIIKEIGDKQLFEIAKNPLLATIICSLHQNGIDVPMSESDIYRKKINLLCESYDRHKNIVRVKTPSEVLEKVCRKIAFFLHEKGLREASFNEFVNTSLVASTKINRDLFVQAVEELVNPCNVLKRDPLTNLYSFGHLRYQEFLSAEELVANRGIDIIPLLTNDWWRGVLYLYACDNQVDGLILDAYKSYSSITKCAGTLRYIFGARPKVEQKSLIQLLDGYIQQDYDDVYEPDIHQTLDEFYGRMY